MYQVIWQCPSLMTILSQLFGAHAVRYLSGEQEIWQFLYLMGSYILTPEYSQVPIKQIGPNKRVGGYFV